MSGYPEHLHEVINEDLQESIYDETLINIEINEDISERICQRGIQGEFYPCKPDVFEQTYEPVEEE